MATALPGTCGRYGVLYLVGAQVLAYDTRAYKDRPPRTWMDFWNVKDFPGRRALSNSGGPFATIVSALVAVQAMPLAVDQEDGSVVLLEGGGVVRLDTAA